MKQPFARLGRIGVVVGLLFTAACIQGPVTGGNGIGLQTGFDIGQVGYQRSEYFVVGVAQSYTPAGTLTNDGQWSVAANTTGRAAFKTRLVVYRPTDAARFNGTVVVEWLNVSAGADIATDWIMAHNELVRSGAVWVGVSAQSVGVNALKTTDSERYGSLVHPGDSYSYDMFSIAGRDIRQNAATVLGGLQPDRMIATGESQSAGRLVTYLDAVQPSARVFDGFMVHSRGAGGARLTQAPLPDVPVPSPLQIRNDLDVPVFVVEAEGDVINSNLGARQPDTARFRLWELAGTSHADAYTANVGLNDIGNSQGAVKMFDFMRNPLAIGCGKPINAGPHHWLFQAALHHLDAWVRSGVAPPVGPRLDVVSTTPVVLARDAQGNALGGVRSPQVDAPVATLGSQNTGAGFCILFGSTTPLTSQQLVALYPTHADFEAAWFTSLTNNVQAGFILPVDAYELYGAAASSQVPN